MTKEWEGNITAVTEELNLAAARTGVPPAMDHLALRTEIQLNDRTSQLAPLLHCGAKACALLDKQEQLIDWADRVAALQTADAGLKSRLGSTIAAALAAVAVRRFRRSRLKEDLDVRPLREAQQLYGKAFGLRLEHLVFDQNTLLDSGSWLLPLKPPIHPAVWDLVNWFASDSAPPAVPRHVLNAALYKPPRKGETGQGVVARLVLEAVPEVGMPYPDPRWTTFFAYEGRDTPEAERLENSSSQFAQNFQESIDTAWKCATEGLSDQSTGVRWWLEAAGQTPLVAHHVVGGSLGGAFAAGMYAILREPDLCPDPSVVICATINASKELGPVAKVPAEAKHDEAKRKGIEYFVVAPEVKAHLERYAQARADARPDST